MQGLKCSASQMLDEVEIVSVVAKPSPVVRHPQDLANFDYDGDIENGLLAVSFKDIAIDCEFAGYIIEAMPDNSDRLGVSDYKSPSLIARPAVVGSTITEVLNLEPDTKYHVTVHAVNYNMVQISPDQRAQDSSSATTLLRAPFLGVLNRGQPHFGSTQSNYGLPCLDCGTYAFRKVDLQDNDFKGAHFALYGAKDETGQHYFRWLAPGDYGPFDHVRDAGKQADMLSFDKDGKVEDHYVDADINDRCGYTHYQFKAVDANGNTVTSELVETNGRLVAWGDSYFQVVFTAESGELTQSVSLGRLVGGNYKAMSDTASVTFKASGALRAFNQAYDEYRRALSDITLEIEDNEDAERRLGEKDTGADHTIWDPRPDNLAKAPSGEPWHQEPR